MLPLGLIVFYISKERSQKEKKKGMKIIYPRITEEIRDENKRSKNN